MLPRKNRLKLLKGSKGKLNFHKKVHSKNFTLFVSQRESSLSNKFFTANLSQSTKKASAFAVSVPKRLDKRTTRRNRTKRLVREAIRQLLPKVESNNNIVVVAKRIFWKEKLPVVLTELRQLFKKSGLLKKDYA